MTQQQHQQPAGTHDLLTITEAADLLRAPVATLRYWRHLGTGPRSFRLGRRVVYRTDDLHAWIERQHDAEAWPSDSSTEDHRHPGRDCPSNGVSGLTRRAGARRERLASDDGNTGRRGEEEGRTVG